MTLKIMGKKAAYQVLALMDEIGGGGVELGRASEMASTWWVHAPGFSPLEEQQVLERLRPGWLLKVEEATYKKAAPIPAPLPKGWKAALDSLSSFGSGASESRASFRWVPASWEEQG